MGSVWKSKEQLDLENSKAKIPTAGPPSGISKIPV
jgi:hypothetical protein